MTYRTFYSADGRRWEVWLILPSSAERRAEERRHQPRERVPERRVATDRRRGVWRRTGVDPAFADGWLCFETEGEKRRLAPVPKNFADADLDELQKWCESAHPVAKCSP